MDYKYRFKYWHNQKEPADTERETRKKKQTVGSHGDTERLSDQRDKREEHERGGGGVLSISLAEAEEELTLQEHSQESSEEEEQEDENKNIHDVTIEEALVPEQQVPDPEPFGIRLLKFYPQYISCCTGRDQVDSPESACHFF